MTSKSTKPATVTLSKELYSQLRSISLSVIRKDILYMKVVGNPHKDIQKKQQLLDELLSVK